MLLGRELETRLIRNLVTGAPQQGGALMLVGDPGIGKSALAALARQHAVAQGLQVLAATGVPAESRLPYAGLYQLLRPLRDAIDQLPGPQRRAIGSAFGQDTGQVPERFLVAVAVTELLTAAAGRQPLLVLADDAHWLDPATCDVLAFLGRRIESEPIVMVGTARDGYDLALLDAGLAEVRIGGLSEEAAGQLLDTVAPGLGPGARGEILAISLGNPLALSELSRGALSPDAGPPAAGSAAVVTDRIEKAFAARWSELPEDTQAVLLAAALNEGGALSETLAAAGLAAGAPLTTESVAPAIAARLADAGPGWLRFRHPLIRSAIESRAGLDKATATHVALASVLAGHPDRRAWHQAAAALGPDEAVAAELDDAASRAERRAAISLAISAVERAVELSADPAARNSRLLRAAQLSFELGRPAMVDRFIRGVNRAGLDPGDRARLALLEESVEAGPAEGAERISYLVELASGVAAAGQRELAMDLLLGAARRCWWSDPGRDARMLVAATATSLAGDQSHPTLQSVLAFAAPDTHGAVVRANLAGLSRAPGLDAVQLTYLGIAGTILGAFERSRVLFAAAVPQLREQGRLGLLVRALNHDAFNCVYACQWADAVTVSDECERVASRAGQHRWIALAKVPVAVVAALHGDDARAERLSSEAQQVLLPAATGSAIALLQTGRTYAALGRRDYHEAYKQLLRVYDPADPAYNHLLRMYHIGDLADAASHSGHHDEARELMDEITAGATEEPGPLLSVSLTFARAMLAPDEDAGTAFEQALTEDLRRWPFHYARLKLEYGSWLRHHRRPTQSREHLRTARDILDALGAIPWRNRADAELRAGGEHRRSEPPLASRFDQLTPQEQQIARMVVSGLSNREIAARLSVSHRTVGYHLYRMFPKLGITSRAEVGTVLAEADELTAS